MDFADKVAECVEHLALEEFDQEYSSLPEEIQDRLWAQAEEHVELSYALAQESRGNHW